MKTLYIFFDDDTIKIPLYDYDKPLFTQLVQSRMGHWEQSERQYHISRSSYDQEQIKTIAAGRPIVEVGKEAGNSVTVQGFILGGQPLLQEALTETVAEKDPMPEYCSVDTAVPTAGLPDQFPEYWRARLETELHSRKYSPKTRTSYVYYNIELCRWLQKTPEEVSSYDIKRYLAYIEKSKQHSAATMNYNLSAFKFFYHNVLKREIVTEQRRPRQDKRLPVVLSKYEVKKMIDSERNAKHRLLLMMVYASGLRVSEVVNLKRENIDFNRKTIFVIGGKGGKDRYTIMSKTVIEALKQYFAQYEITETSDWLFPSYIPNRHLTIRSAQKIFKQALKKARIGKTASIHSLRHSFATHLLESGTDISFIKNLLGHESLRTTERYTHVARRKTLKITSPLDTIDEDDED